MNRRDFLMTSSCFLATPAVALAAQAYAARVGEAIAIGR